MQAEPGRIRGPGPGGRTSGASVRDSMAHRLVLPGRGLMQSGNSLWKRIQRARHFQNAPQSKGSHMHACMHAIMWASIRPLVGEADLTPAAPSLFLAIKSCRWAGLCMIVRPLPPLTNVHGIPYRGLGLLQALVPGLEGRVELVAADQDVGFRVPSVGTHTV